MMYWINDDHAYDALPGSHTVHISPLECVEDQHQSVILYFQRRRQRIHV